MRSLETGSALMTAMVGINIAGSAAGVGLVAAGVAVVVVVGTVVGGDKTGVAMGATAGTGSAGVAVTVFEIAPAPTAFTARIRTPYSVPFVKPVMSIGVAVDAGLRVTHDSPLSEY